MAIDGEKETTSRFNELSEETQVFLVELRCEDIAILKDGLRLVMAMQTVGSFMKWFIIGVLGVVVGTVMFGEAVSKILY